MKVASHSNMNLLMQNLNDAEQMKSGQDMMESLCPKAAADRMECYQCDAMWWSDASLSRTLTHAYGLAVRVLRGTYELKRDEKTLVSKTFCVIEGP